MYWVKIGKHFLNLANAQQVFDRRDVVSTPQEPAGPFVFVRWEEAPGSRSDPRFFYGEDADELMRHLEAVKKTSSA